MAGKTCRQEVKSVSPQLNLDVNWLAARFPNLSSLQAIGSGGFKVVYSCHHQSHGSVVLKIIQAGQDIETIRREIIAVNQVNSTRVPRVLETGSMDIPNVGTCIWFLEKRVSGSTLRQVLANDPLTTTDLLKLGLQTLEVLAESECAQIVHRDVKPENIMYDNQGEYWLLDFGIARHLTLDSLTATARPFGKFTMGYAPPEQMRNMKSDIDCRADLFALGVTLYESATGANPFVYGARDDLEKIRRVEQMPLPRLSLTFSAASDFASLIEAMTQKRRHHRPDTIADAMAWMQDICARENIR